MAQQAVRVKVTATLHKVTKENKCLGRRAAELQKSEELHQSCQQRRTTMPTSDTTTLALQCRKMNQTFKMAQIEDQSLITR